jgi:hypothetical protein
MPINLRDIPDAVRAYLDTRVNVTISALSPAKGSIIIPNEEFTFKINATNANAFSGGVGLRNVRYRILVTNPAVAKLKVPSGGRSTDPSGNELKEGEFVEEFIFYPKAMIIESLSGGDTEESALTSNYLGVGDTDTLALRGKAGSNGSGGMTTIKARVFADLDLNALFPKNQDTPFASRNVTVEG